MALREGVKVAMQAMSVSSEIVSISNQRGFFKSHHYNNLELGRPWMTERLFVY